MIARALAALGRAAVARLERLPAAMFATGARPSPASRLTFYGQSGPYLTRYTLAQGPRYGLHVHRFHRGDEDDELHSHPWAWAASLVLAGGYREWRLAAAGVVARELGPGSVNVLRPDTFHRVELLGAEAWTLIVTGPKAGSWSFLDAAALVPWRDFLASKGMAPARVEPKDDEEGRLCGVSPHVP